jgi:hypothetical protein
VIKIESLRGLGLNGGLGFLIFVRVWFSDWLGLLVFGLYVGVVRRHTIRLVSKGTRHSFDQRLNGIAVCFSKCSEFVLNKSLVFESLFLCNARCINLWNSILSKCKVWGSVCVGLIPFQLRRVSKFLM